VQYAVNVPNFGECFEPRTLVSMAQDAERAGWDGFFIWDHVLLWPTPMVDPWVALAAIALVTERVRIGTLVTPLPRRRPVKLAREIVSLDHLSNGRLILGVGIGDGPWEWAYLGEEPDLRTRGAMLDEGLELLRKLWTGEPVLHAGRFYHYRGDFGPGRPETNPTPFLPRLVQSPRVPVWVAGAWPNKPPFRRAARWDGVVPIGKGGDMGRGLEPAEVRALVAYVRAHRPSEAPFDVVVGGHTAGEHLSADRSVVEPYVAAGATWWIESISPWSFGWEWQGPWPFAAMRERIRRGPPRI
jgi:alkanesulfonate monooxygenase SsuD/methylene tetrahydromethanopterin reductase-like flavin-dependent oxidoreductase (luciferase family)